MYTQADTTAQVSGTYTKVYAGNQDNPGPIHPEVFCGAPARTRAPCVHPAALSTCINVTPLSALTTSPVCF